MTSTSPTSPLTEASSESLDVLMSLSPADTTPEQERRIIAALRSQRKQWKEAEASGTKPKTKKTPSAPIDINDINALLDF